MSDSTDSLSAAPGKSSTFTRQQVDRLLEDQRLRSRLGESFLVESYLEKQPALQADSEALLDLIYNEILLREASGESPRLQEYVGRFPQLAQELANQFEIEQALQEPSLQETEQMPRSSVSEAVSAPADRLHGYELLEILGRGGKGVVYKARQRSLNRIVALKMIQAGMQASPEELARFRLEAEAVARLEHPHLVHIFEVGEWQGQPFLALEFVAGGNLAQRLDETPWPAADAARLIETLARAMHHAHGKGIVHRDLKPANILLASLEDQSTQNLKEAPPLSTPPSTGHWSQTTFPKITDFGLAKFMIGETEGLTETGSFLGTPSYTAPEQAAGWIDGIGPATDVYALGAMLYELLTGRPPFQAPTIMLILEQVRSAEPLAVTRLRADVPRDLETICLKCLEKDPRRRYASAQLLAEDLQRFQAGQPIQARPVGRLERVLKWVKRRPAVAALISVVVLGTLTLLVGGWWTALTVGAARRQAEDNLIRAEADLNRALAAVEHLLEEVGAVELIDVPQLEPVRKKLLLKAKGFYDQFLEERGDDPKLRFQAGRGFSRLGAIQEFLGEHAAAEKSFRHACALLEEKDRPSPEQRRELGRAHNQLGGVLKKLGRNPAAEEELRQALHVFHGLVADYPLQANLQQDLAASLHDLGTVLARLPRQRAQARAAYEEALHLQQKLALDAPLPEWQRDRARTLNNLGILLQHTDPQDAKKALEKAVVLNQDLLAKHADVSAYRREYARTCHNLAGLFAALKKDDDAKQKYDQALALLRELVNDFPKVPAYRRELAGVLHSRGLFHENLGDLCHEKKQYGERTKQYLEAGKAYEESIGYRRKLAGEAPRVPEYQHQLAYSQVTLGILMRKKKLFQAAEAHFRHGMDALDKIAVPGAPAAYLSDLAQVLHHRALLLMESSTFMDPVQSADLIAHHGGGTLWPVATSTICAHGALVEATEFLQRAVSCQRKALEADQDNAAFQKWLHEHNLKLLMVALKRKDHAQAVEAAREMSRIFPKSKNDALLAAKALAQCIPLAAADPRLGPDQRQQLVESYARQAVQLLRLAVRLRLDRPEALAHPVFTPVKDRADFKEVLEALKKNAVRSG